MNLDTDLIYTWPLVVLIQDDYLPDSAPLVVDAIKDLDDGSCKLTFALYAMGAEAWLERN